VDAATAATLDRLRVTLDARGPGAGAAVLGELEPLLAREPELAPAHALEARARLALWQRNGAERAARRALELDPELADGELALAAALSTQGRHGQAVESAYRARRLAPLEAPIQVGLARTLLFAGRADEVVRITDTGLAIHPELAPLWRWRSLALLQRGESGAAGEALARAIRLAKGPLAPAIESGATSASLETLRAEWRAELDAAGGQRLESPYARASLYALLAEREPALAELERSIAAREAVAIFVPVAPWFDLLRHEPRFVELVRRIESAENG
jgi:tetratricopeptide (TPR) repeat protein